MDATKVSAGKPNVGGAIHTAPVGTTLPTDTATELDAAFKDLGYVSEDGVTNANSPEIENVKAWGGATVLSSQKGRPDTFKFKMIESLNPEVLKTAYGSANVTGALADGIAVSVNAGDMGAKAWVIDVLLKGGAKRRTVIPEGSVTALGDIVYSDNGAIGYEVTIMAAPDSAGNTHYEYTKAVAVG